MRPLIIVFLLTLLSSCQSRILTIEEFGGKSDAAINVEKEAVPHPEFLHSSRQNSPFYTHKIHNNHRYLARSHHRSKYHNEEVIQQAINNTRAYNLALKAAKPGDTVLLHENDSYSFIGGIEGVGLQDITLDFAGYTRFIYDTDRWPMREWTGGKEDGITEEYVPAIDMLDCRGIVITCSATNKAIVSVDYEKNEIYLDEDSGIGGIIDGHGKKWWDDAIMGDIHVDSRPRLIDIRGSMDVTLEHVTLVNSPYWTLTLEAIGAEVHHVNILVDRNYQRNIVNNTYFNDEHLVRDYSNSDTAIEVGRRNLRDARKLPQLKFHFPEIPDWILQPQDLNTDGIDPIGRDIYIHDCIVLNDDDSIAVKPPRNGRKGSVMNGTIPYECTGNITIEDMVLTGFGASIGSVGPMESHPCVDNVSFKNIRMPGTGKGIYIKSNKSDCHGKVSSSITNIKYENVHIKQPIWWPIWIGPQQQQEPHQSLGGACSLEYPLDRTSCPTQGCTTFENITIKDVLIEDPLLSPGVIMGNSSNPMKNIVFDNVTMNVPYKYYLTHGRLPFHTKRFPFTGRYECQNVGSGTCKNCNPVPDCF